MFQIIIPHTAERRTSQDVAELVRVGLGDLVDGAAVTAVAETPTEYGGFLWYWPRPGAAPRFGYAPERQTWLPAVALGEMAAGRYWIGFENETPLTPADLKRKLDVGGRRLTLGDGKEWLIPAEPDLPRNLIVGDYYEPRMELQSRFADFGAECERWRERLATGEYTHPFADLIGTVLMGLRLNYRMTPEVANHLCLLSTANIYRAVLACLGAAEVRE